MFKRPQFFTVLDRIQESRFAIQVLIGPRQIGKTTLSSQIEKAISIPTHFCSADIQNLSDGAWIIQQWNIGRELVKAHQEALIIIDEIQKISEWSSVIKKLWDEDTRHQVNLKVILLGSSSLALQYGLSESLAGRFEIIPIPHWSFKECQQAFQLTVNEYIYFGGYPGALPLRKNEERFRSYIKDSLVDTAIMKDVLMLSSIKKPALLRRVFEMACVYAGQILSYQKILGQVQDNGNVATLEHYLKLLQSAGLVCGIDKFANEPVRRRASSPKLLVYNTALFTIAHEVPFESIQDHPELWGRYVETAIGAHLLNSGRETGVEVFYWKEGQYEVDYVLKYKDQIIALEVKSNYKKASLTRLDRFRKQFNPQKILLVGADGIPIEEFLSHSSNYWFI